MKNRIFILLISVIALNVNAQQLSLQEYLKWTMDFHPVAKQAALLSPMRNAQLMQAKGLFDPVLESKFKEKQLDNNLYYSNTNIGIDMKTPYAVSIVSDYDLNSGNFLNPDDFTSDKGLLSLGVALPVIKGLMFDEQRLGRQRAQKLNDIASVEIAIALNEILYQNTQLYAQWYIAEKKLQLTSELLTLSQTRFNAIKQRYIGGDRSGIDTLEAFAQVQSRQIQLLDARQDMLKSRIAMVAFLQDSDSSKLQLLNLKLTPSDQFENELRSWIPHSSQIKNLNSHPEIQVSETKLDILSLEERWKREKIKPKFDIEYRFLQKDFSPFSPSNFSTNNYTVGFQFSSPLFLREARGDLKMQQLKINEATLGLDWKKNQIEQKSAQLQTSYSIIQEQLNISSQLVSSYAALLAAENIKFTNGESSVFLLNQRENTLFENQLKLIDLKKKDFQSRIDQGYLWVLPYERNANSN